MISDEEEAQVERFRYALALGATAPRNTPPAAREERNPIHPNTPPSRP